MDCTPDSHFDYTNSLRLTADLISSGQTVIYEAAFVADGVLCAVDIMVKSGDRWDVYEVKSTTKVKKQHKVDAALQYWVLQRCGIAISTMNIMHLSSSYVKTEDPVDIQLLFEWGDVTQDVIQLQDYVESQVAQQVAILDIEDCVPEVPIGPHCVSPYKCDFYTHCWRELDLPEYNIMHLSYGYGKQWDLLSQGVRRVQDIPMSYPLSHHAQKVQVACEKSGHRRVDIAQLQDFVGHLQFPLYFLDFETIMTPVPIFGQSRCYQQLCFQYSLHIQPEVSSSASSGVLSVEEMVSGGLLLHREYLAPATLTDPRPLLIEHLLSDIGQVGSIVVYNQSFEENRLREMIVDFPQYAEALSGLVGRLVDLASPFQQKHLYCKEMRGKYSLKAVLPALVPSMQEAYSSLRIGEGGAAMNTFLQLMQGEYVGDVAQARESLLQYCALDTWAMVKLLDVIVGVASGSDGSSNAVATVLSPCEDPEVSPLLSSAGGGDGGEGVFLEGLSISTRSEPLDTESHTDLPTDTHLNASSVTGTDTGTDTGGTADRREIGDLQSCEGTGSSPAAVMTTPDPGEDCHPPERGGVLVQCVMRGGRLRVCVVTEGFDPDKYCQFPSCLREEGRVFLVDAVVDAGKFYRVKGSISPQL